MHPEPCSCKHPSKRVNGACCGPCSQHSCLCGETRLLSKEERRKGKACARFCFSNLNFRSWDEHRLRNQKFLLGQVAHTAFHSLIQMSPRLICSITMHLTVNIHHSGDLLGYWARCCNKMIMLMLRRSACTSSSWLQTAPSSAPSTILLC